MAAAVAPELLRCGGGELRLRINGAMFYVDERKLLLGLRTTRRCGRRGQEAVLELPIPLVGPGPLNRLTGPLNKV